MTRKLNTQESDTLIRIEATLVYPVKAYETKLS